MYFDKSIVFSVN